ncbi:hypothetical protein [Brevibacillus laterosporus]|uniref:hypothetical protein n=1 Tax=Brevibacillus laterosporus TaxID=1465 RepID=UPI003D23E195
MSQATLVYLHSVAPISLPREYLEVLSTCEIDIISAKEWEQTNAEISGWLFTESLSILEWQQFKRDITRCLGNKRLNNRPYLVLLAGDNLSDIVAYEFIKRLQPFKDSIEIIRLLCWMEQKRAILGSSICECLAENDFAVRNWHDHLRRAFSIQGYISFVCRYEEAVEIAWARQIFLNQKTRFYHRIASRCDELGARANIVGQGLGMDRRIGQEWLFPNVYDERTLQQEQEWLEREWNYLLQQVSVKRVAIWGYSPIPGDMLAQLSCLEVSCYLQACQQKTNNLPSDWHYCNTPLEAAKLADALLILRHDQDIRSIRLDNLYESMAKPNVLDVVDCFPSYEAKLEKICYRTLGQNPNVWNGTDYNGI